MTKIILGGGISGLSAAYYALKKFPNQKLILIEASDRVGGWLKSTKQDDGTILEQSARTLRPRGKPGISTLQLIDELGLQNEIIPVSPVALNRMIYANGKIHKLPSNFFNIFKKQAPFSKPLAIHLIKDVFTPRKLAPNNDEPIYDFVNRRFGSEVADYLISPLVCGICGGDAKEISVKFLMESMFDMEQKHGSITKGILANLFNSSNSKDRDVKESDTYKRAVKENWSVYSFKNGIETLPNMLHNNIVENGVDIKMNTKVNRIETHDDSVTVYLANGATIQGTHLISSLPARSLSLLLEQQHPTLSMLLSSIPTISMCVINLKYNQQVIKNEGFGFLVAPKENLPILGVIYDSCCFPKSQNTVLTVMMGGFKFDKIFTSSSTESEAIDLALKQIGSILGITVKPEFSKVTFLRNCIPQYVVGHKSKIDSINEYISNSKLCLSLCGASYYGVGINDVILSARNAVNNIKC